MNESNILYIMFRAASLYIYEIVNMPAMPASNIIRNLFSKLRKSAKTVQLSLSLCHLQFITFQSWVLVNPYIQNQDYLPTMQYMINVSKTDVEKRLNNAVVHFI